MQITEFGNPASGRVLLQPADRRELAELEAEAAQIEALAGPDFQLLALEIEDWNRELSPWPAPPVFGSEGFGGEAARTLAALLPLCANRDKSYYLGGYSLAGLFALWAAGQSEVFSGAAAASPSLWFPGFGEYAAAHVPRCPVYLSLGDREEKTRNPVMAQVGERIRGLHALLRQQGVPCTLEWNPGNHFRDPALRTARAFAWVLRQE